MLFLFEFFLLLFTGLVEATKHKLARLVYMIAEIYAA